MENIIPITPNSPPPIINANNMVTGCIPVVSPIIFGAKTLFSTHCIPTNRIATHKALMGLFNRAKIQQAKPMKGPKYGIISAIPVIIPITIAKSIFNTSNNIVVATPT